MKLFYAPGACSLSPHIALLEAEIPYQLVKVDVGAKTIENGDDYWKVNPKGQVPALELDDGRLLTEGSVIVQMIADRVPEKKLAPPANTSERYQLQAWLSFITSEIHKNFSPVFNSAIPEDVKPFFKTRIINKFRYMDENLAGRQYLVGGQFTVADSHVVPMLRWAENMKLDLSPFANLLAFKERVFTRPRVQQAMKIEGLLTV